jgi:hypothetical protein
MPTMSVGSLWHENLAWRTLHEKVYGSVRRCERAAWSGARSLPCQLQEEADEAKGLSVAHGFGTGVYSIFVNGTVRANLSLAA